MCCLLDPASCLLDPASCLLTCLASDWPSFVPLLSRTPTSALCPSHCTQVRAVCLLDCFLSTFGRRCLFPWFLVERNSFRAESLGKTLLRSPPSGFFLPCSFNPLLLYLDGRNYCASCMPPLGQFRLTLRDPMDCSLPGSSVHGIFQARVLEWGAIAFSHIQLFATP